MTPSKVALITGAGSGIGRCLSRILAAEGWAIATVDLREEGVRALTTEVNALHQRCAWRIADVTDAAALFQATRELEAELGPVDLLVANAGIGIETSALSYNTADMNKVIAVNLIGVSNSIGAVLPGMIERKRGHLVGISSIASYRGLPRLLAYSASKAGVNALMEGLRVELTPLGIHTTIVCPGWVRTPLTEQIEGELEHLVEVDAAAVEIAYAIRHRLWHYTFPRPMRWKMGFMMYWPRSWQDAMIRSQMHRVQMKKKEA
jgi:NAD(P)-dependent dehydrogenase (short-subunit alcohol dehydrogenase family)